MPLDYRVISIGTLAGNPLWNEKPGVRTGHATTTLISSDQVNILVDPSLPTQALLARLSERSHIRADDITHVFMTSATPEHMRAIAAFDDAQWFIHEPERAAAIDFCEQEYHQAESAGDTELGHVYQARLAVLRRCEIAPDSLAPNVDLFPMPGVTPGCCGLIIALPASTVVICGDAIATQEHLVQGKVLPQCADHEQAMTSFREAIEIADVLILGRDNMVINPLRRM